MYVMLLSKWVYVLIGDDKTGKTSFQKKLAKMLCGENYKSLPRNRLFKIYGQNMEDNDLKIFFSNRSIQEQNLNAHDYFEKEFQDADVAILSSHLVLEDIKQIIDESHLRYYNVGGVFWTNSIIYNNELNQKISLLNWNERFVIDNPIIDNYDNDLICKNIEKQAAKFLNMLIKRFQLQ